MNKNKEFHVGDTVVPILTKGVVERGHAYKVDAVMDGFIKLEGFEAFFPAEKFARQDMFLSTFVVVSYSPKDGHVLGIDAVAEFDWKSRPEGMMSLFHASGTFSWIFYESIKAGDKIYVRGGENEVIGTAWKGDKLIGDVRRATNPYRNLIK